MKIVETVREKSMMAFVPTLLLVIGSSRCAEGSPELEDLDASSGDASSQSGDSATGGGAKDAANLPDTPPQIPGGVEWTLSQKRTDTVGSVSLTDALTKSGQVYFKSYVQGVVPRQLSNGSYLVVRVTVQVPSTSKTPINIPAGTYPCASGSVENGTTFVQVKIDDYDGTEFTTWTSSSCNVVFTEAAVRGGVFIGRFSGTAVSPLTAAKVPFDGTFRVNAPK